MKWLEPSEVSVPPAVSDAVGGHPLVARALVRRGLCTAAQALAFLDPSCYRPTSPLALPDMGAAAERLRRAIDQREAILVWGDFDVDGITATALLVEGLEELGGRVFWHIPHRERESHGVHWPSLQPFLGRGVRVLLTCDTGISCHATLKQAQKMGLDVLVTDHHDLTASLPPARAIVNPKRLGEDHALRHLSGAGVAYKLAEALGSGKRALDLVALGLVADVVPQLRDVRYLVQRGLDALRAGERVGLRALAEAADLNVAEIDEHDISYSLAPRLNALGRLADASIGVRLFLENDLARARSMAAEAEALNVRRQFLSKQVTEAASAQVIRDASLASLPVLVLSHPEWPSSVLGIAASRLVERYSRPVVLIATPPGEMARGSARSLAGVDIREALAAHRDLLGSFGGHPMAAGFSISAERIPELRRRLVQTIADLAGAGLPAPELPIEAYLRIPELSLHLAEELARLAPFGPGNPPVHLATCGLRAKSARVLGRTGEHRVVKLQDEDGQSVSAFWWHSRGLPLPEGPFDLAYVLRIDRFQGEPSLQLEWIDARGPLLPSVGLRSEEHVPDVADYRGFADPLPVLRALRKQSDIQVWAEACAVAGFEAVTRRELGDAAALAIWSIPPSTQVLTQALGIARPQSVCLFAVDPGLDAFRPFTRRLGGLVKHALAAYHGQLEWASLAAAMAHRVATVQTGVEWLAATGQLSMLSTGPEQAVVEARGESDPETARALETKLMSMLEETAAYRRYYREADADRLVSLGG